ncbi:MAG: cell division protein FtsZ [Saprospiraceae bacterium]|nr:cell division protein FtsZ [Saprospiraceae bacterium]
MQFEIHKNNSTIIKVLGVGGGGSNAVNHMQKLGIQGVDFAISNTDVQSMLESRVETKLQLGPVRTEGRGAGSMPEVGKEACIESIDEIREFLQEGAKMVFITAGLGGGTGTGAAPIIAKAARDLGILTIGIVTMPFKFEGARRIRQAIEGLEELKKNVDSIIVISNDKLRNMYGNLPLSQAFEYADNILTTAAKGIAEIITVPGYINVDFEDVNTVMKDSGITVMGSAMAEGDSRAKKAVENALNSQLLEDNDIRGAKHILLNISSGTKEVTMDEIGEITEYIQGEAGYGTDLIWGNCKNDNLGEKISVTVIATGFEMAGSNNIGNKHKQQVFVPLDDEIDKRNSGRNEEIKIDINDSINIIDFEVDDIKDTINAFQTTMEKSSEKNVFEERDARLEKMRNKVSRTGGAREMTTKKISLENPTTINRFENEPAYKRKQVMLDSNPEKFDPASLSFKVGIDEDEPVRRNNAFLHDNVD